MPAIPNIYPQTEQIDDPQVEKVGKIKTILFIFIFLLSMLITAIYYSTSSFNATQVVKEPSYSEYLSAKSEHDMVTCDCANVATQLNTFTTQVIEPDTFCSESTRVFGACNGFYSAVCPGSEAWSFLNSLTVLCDIALTTIGDTMDSLQDQLIVSNTLLSKNALEQRVYAQGSLSAGFADSMLKVSENMIRTSQLVDRPDLYTEQDGSYFDPAPDGSTCHCEDAWACTKVINDEDTGELVGTRYCSVFMTIMMNPVSVWSSPSWWKDDGIFGNHPSMPNLYISHETEGLIMDETSAYFDEQFETMFREGMSSELDLTINHEQYYNQCAPLECEYVTQRNRSSIEVMVVLAGLIGGLKVLCDTLVNLFFKKADAKALASYRDSKVTGIKVQESSDIKVEEAKVQPQPEAEAKPQATNEQFAY